MSNTTDIAKKAFRKTVDKTTETISKTSKQITKTSKQISDTVTSGGLAMGRAVYKIHPWVLFKKRLEALKLFFAKSPFISAILFITFAWFSIAAVVANVEEGAEGANIKGYTDSIWWGIVTLLTVGYGDRFPVTPVGRVFGSLLMVSGVVAIAIVTAKVSSYFLERALRERRGFVDPALLNNHFVILGWKEEMAHFLLHILDSNKNILAESIVLLNNAPDSEIENLLSLPRLKKVKVIKGEFYIETHLRRCAPERAVKILILADATPNQLGQIPTMTEADARTIMTAMTLNNVAKGVPVAAEVLDAAMDQYLKLAHVNEIIYTREYSRMLVAMASTGTGVTNVMHDLLSPHSPYYIGTVDIPENCIGHTYNHLREVFDKNKSGMAVIGILENSGNSHVAKESAIRKAQQTPNVAQLVENLKGVKTLRFNQPLFIPGPEYKIKEGSMAIVIENRADENGEVKPAHV